MNLKVKLSIFRAILNGVTKADCIAHTVSGTLSVEDSQNFCISPLNMLQFHNIANITKQLPDRFPPT